MSQRHVECIICGNTDYSLVDGLYYCTLCQTQSQHFAVELAETTETAGFAASIPTGNLLIGSQKKQKLEKSEIPLSPYALYEAYAIIFEKLAATLVRLGLPATIKVIN